MTRLRARLGALGRWATDWRTGATVVASILVALLAVVVIDSIQSRRASDARADRTITELERRGIRIDDLAAQLEAASTSRDRLAEEVRALRELLIAEGLVEPRPAGTAPQQRPQASPRAGSSPRPRTSAQPQPKPKPTTAPKPKPKPSPKPSPPPSPCTVRNPLTGDCLVPTTRKARR